MLSAGIFIELSISNLLTTSFAKSIGMDGKSDMTLNYTIHSSGSMYMPCIWFMNVVVSISAYSVSILKKAT